MEREYKMSAARAQELQEELNYLKTTRSDEVAEQIKIARGFGGPGGLQIIQFLLQLVLASLAHFVFFFHFGCSFHYPEVYNTPNLPWFYIVIGIFRIVKGKRP